MDRILDLGLIDYREALKQQRVLFEQVYSAGISSSMIVCRHHPIITMGRSSASANVTAGPEVLAQKGIGVMRVDRGGDVTYHGPGQLVAYPVCDLRRRRDIRWFLRLLEQAAIAVLEDFGIAAHRRAGLTGVWIKTKKIASIGIAVRHWITYHGIALNIFEDDCRNFRLIRPCGMDVEMVSMQECRKNSLTWEAVRDAWIRRFNYA